MNIKFFNIISIIILIIITSCHKEAPKVGEIIGSTRRTISPHSINISGLKLYNAKEEVQKIIVSINCEEKDLGITNCSWKRTKKDSQDYFKGIDQINLTFYKDTLQEIRIQYSQMFDVEYKNFEEAVREKYAYAIADFITDSTGLEWQYDSLKISLVPNKKQHWTGSIFVFNPILDFQEQTIQKRWLKDVEQNKIKKVF